MEVPKENGGAATGMSEGMSEPGTLIPPLSSVPLTHSSSSCPQSHLLYVYQKSNGIYVGIIFSPRGTLRLNHLAALAPLDRCVSWVEKFLRGTTHPYARKQSISGASKELKDSLES